jgi:hypothetical protein
MIFHVWMQGVVQCPWDPMVEIPTLTKRGCGRLRYVWLIVTMLKIGKNRIPCAWTLGIVHAQDMHDHPIDDFNLAILLWVAGHGFGELGIQS